MDPGVNRLVKVEKSATGLGQNLQNGKRRHGSEWDRTRSELDKLIEEQAVLKVNYKGSVSYRNAAKVLRGRRKGEQGKCAVKQPSLPDFSTGDSALGPADEDQMEDMEDVMSTTAGMDSSMDEEGDESSLDAMCAQSTTDSGISLSPITSCNISLPLPSPAASPTHDSLRQDGDSAYTLPERTQTAAQHDTASLEFRQQPLAICSQGEEGPRVEESALTPDPLLSDCRNTPNELVKSIGGPHILSVCADEGEKCNNGPKSTTEIDIVNNGGVNNANDMVKEEIRQDPLYWSVADVVSYFNSVGFPEQAVAFRTQEIDGKSLLLMQAQRCVDWSVNQTWSRPQNL